jgi:hypothetical protein
VRCSDGIDEPTCGSLEFPCASFVYAVDLAVETSLVEVLNDDSYYMLNNTFDFPAKFFSITGVREYDKENEIFISPKLLYSYETEAFFEFTSSDTRAVISNVTIYIDGAKGLEHRYVLHQTASGSGAYVDFRHVHFDGMNKSHFVPIVYMEGNSPTYYEHCVFTRFSFNFRFYNTGLFCLKTSPTIQLSNCFFSDISCLSNHTVVLNSPDIEVPNERLLIIENSMFLNITADGGSSSGLLIYIRYTGVNSTNTSYTNITGKNGYSGGVYYVGNDSLSSIALSRCYFSNISIKFYGGAICTVNPVSFKLLICVFERCRALSGKGGAVYIGSTGFFSYSSCNFLENKAASGGNDIDHEYNIIDNYSSVDFLDTCSDSASPQTLFPNGRSMDNYLIGVFAVIISNYIRVCCY